MIKYTIEDLKKLAEIYNNLYRKPLENFSNIQDIELFDYNNLINHILKEKNNKIEDTLIELIGYYEFVVSDLSSFISLYNLLFEIPLSALPLFSSSENYDSWKNTIIQWRTLIGK